MDDRFLTRFTAIGRVAIGTGFVLYPPLSMRPWIGREASRPGAKLLARALGARDVVIGAGTLAGLAREEPLPWLRAALAADATDLALTLLERDELPPGGRELIIGVAGIATAIGAKLVFLPDRAD